MSLKDKIDKFLSGGDEKADDKATRVEVGNGDSKGFDSKKKANGVPPVASAANDFGAGQYADYYYGYNPEAFEGKEPALDKDGKPIVYRPFFKRKVEEKLTIFLIENVNLDLEIVTMMIPKIATSGYVCFINYADRIKTSEIVEVKAMNVEEELKCAFLGEKIRFYDALLKVDEIVSQKLGGVVNETNLEKVSIEKIDIVGIGTARDIGSETSEDISMAVFSTTVGDERVINRYYCLTDNDVIGAAKVGFRSIGTISKKYV